MGLTWSILVVKEVSTGRKDCEVKDIHVSACHLLGIQKDIKIRKGKCNETQFVQ